MTKTDLDLKLDRILNEILFVKQRISTYLGNREALTYLVDETPIFVNTDDIGCPINVLNGGKYEEDYLRVLASYRKAHSTFLDIGANLGIYSLRLAPMLRSGRIISFEPSSRVRELFSRSVYLNNLGHVIDVRPIALSDVNGEAPLAIPLHHAGGASLEAGYGDTEQVQLRSLDSMVDESFTCDLVKLDVEGHEFKVLKGMERVLRRSPGCIVLFEKLIEGGGTDEPIYRFFESLGWDVYVIDGTRLSRVSLHEFCRMKCYFVAGLPSVIENGGLDRDFLDIFPSDLNIVSGEMVDEALHVRRMRATGEILFHAPYWYLPRGFYRLEFDGELSGDLRIQLSERFGYLVQELTIDRHKRFIEFPVERDLCQFELVCRSHSRARSFMLRKFRLRRMG